MNLDRVGSGNDVPNEINVIIEIPAHSDPVKYELDKKTGAMFVDRFMSTAMHYPSTMVMSRTHCPATVTRSTCWCSRRRR